jgi:ABC-2 type transport system ATP-binding protein
MPAITVERLSKRFGAVTAVDDLSFEVGEGTITGFLGPNGAGKTTTLRTLLGLISPTSGTATFGGRPYRELPEPSREVGALLEASGFHPGRSGRDHLRVLAAAGGIPTGRVDEVLGLVGLADAATRRAGGYSLGMRQRLGLAAALLGDPRVLVLDEPANGLDPEGVHWLRTLLRHLAAEGRSVLVSSHLLAEMAQTVDHVVIVARGRLVAESSLAELTARAGGQRVRVRTPQVEALSGALAARGVTVEPAGPDELLVAGTGTEAVGRAVAAAGVVVYEMRLERPDLEAAFLELTAAQTEGVLS